MKQQNLQHENAIKHLESLRSKIGDENFIIFLIGVVNQCGNEKKTPMQIAVMCEKSPKLLYKYVQMYIADIKRKVKNEDVSIDDNIAGWMRAVGEGPPDGE